jgi:2-oxoglutarate dehydrogenase E1 component
MSATATPYGEAMYEAWRKDPNSVHVSWRTFFENEEAGYGKGTSYTSPPSMLKATPLAAATGGVPPQPSSESDILFHIKVERLIRAYETRGHNIAELDPLGIHEPDLCTEIPRELTLEHYGFSEADLKRTVIIPPMPIFSDEKKMTLGEVIDRLKSLYCHHVGFQYMFIQEQEQKRWIQEQISTFQAPMSQQQKRKVAEDLIAARGFELFLQKKFVSEKRFGIDGGESLIAGMRQLLRRGVDLGVEMAVLGMPHRGRLNVLANVMNKPVELIFNEFQSNLGPDDEGSGDVKYHLGMSSDVTFDDSGRSMHLSLMANPSHLEAVNPVVEGKARAEQDYRGDTERKRVLPILLHGDAAFAGQGVVYETLGFSQLPAYTAGGTVHIVVNNQIGFTTDPRVARSSPYSIDIAKIVGVFVFYVNGDDVEVVVRCCEAVIEWR